MAPNKQKVAVPPSLEEAAAAKPAPGARQDDSSQRLAASDKRQGANAEENLRFLLQKELTQSDVGDLGRIVLPKMEAELHLPELKTKDGISIPMEDIETSRVYGTCSTGFGPTTRAECMCWGTQGNLFVPMSFSRGIS